MNVFQFRTLILAGIILQWFLFSVPSNLCAKEPEASSPPQLAKATIDLWQKAGGFFRDSKSGEIFFDTNSLQLLFPSNDRSLSGCFVISDRAYNIDLAKLPQPCKEFGMRLGSCWITKQQIAQLSRFEKLTYLVIECSDEGQSELDDQSLAELGKCKHLKSLVISHKKFGDISYAAIAQLHQLERLRLDESSISNDGFASTTGFPTLRYFNLSSANIANNGLRKLCSIKSLREFHIAQKKCDHEGFSDMHRLVNLETLSVWPAVGREGMQALCRVKNLRSLDVLLSDKKGRGHPPYPRIADNKRLGLEFVHELENLEELRLSGRFFNAVDIDYLATLPRLNTLSFEKSVLNEKACASIAKLENLKVLSLGSLQTDDAIAPICFMDNLEELDCSQSLNISDFGLTNLHQMKSLRRLSLSNTKISNSTVLRRLVKMPQIETLDLSGTWINDRSVKPLGTMKGLRILDIHSTDITSQGSLKLEFKLPDTKVISSQSE